MTPAPGTPVPASARLSDQLLNTYGIRFTSPSSSPFVDDNRILFPEFDVVEPKGRVGRRKRLGGMPNYYHREAA